MPQNQKKIKQELGKIYDSKYAALKAGKSFKQKAGEDFAKTFDRHPILKKLLFLGVLANLGIYTLIILFAFYWRH